MFPEEKTWSGLELLSVHHWFEESVVTFFYVCVCVFVHMFVFPPSVLMLFVAGQP